MDRKKMNNQPPNVPVSQNPLNDIQHPEECPMMLNTWTQTSNTDLGINENFSPNANLEQAHQREEELLQKIRELEEIVRQQNRSIIDSAENLTRQNQILESVNCGHQQVSAIIANPQSYRRRYVPYNPRLIPNSKKQPTSTRISGCSPVQDRQNYTQRNRQNIIPPSIQGQTPSSERNLNSHRMNYTIISEGAHGQEEPMEIEISEETNEMNFNCSADSGRLEICLSEPMQIKTEEVNINYQPQSISQYIPTPNLSPEELQPSTSKHCRAISRTSEVNKQPTPISQYIPTRSLSPEELQPSTSKHCRPLSRTSTTYNLSPEELQPSTSKHCQAISRTSEVNKEPTPISQYIPTRSLSPEELQPSTSKHCRPLSRTSTTYNLSPEELQPSTSKHCRALLSKNTNSLNKIGRKQKEPKKLTAQIEPTRREYLIIGPNRTLIEVNVLNQITWDRPSRATRRLLSALFSRETLATHSLTGRQSPAFKDKPIKKKLDEKTVEDIIYFVSRKCGVSEKQVRSVVTTKCADENKMWRLSKSKNKGKEKENKKKDDA